MIFILLIFQPGFVCGQKTFSFDKDDITKISIIAPEHKNGFEVAVSLVAMFTSGSIVRDGFRLGAGVVVQQHIGDWTISAGLDAFKENHRFGVGVAYAGFAYFDGNYGFNYYCNKYYQGDKQLSGIVGLQVHDFSVNFEDDILALPFTGFVLHDRYRTAALEFGYKNFILGTNVYTNEANGLRNPSSNNYNGIYHTGIHLSSPVYIGYKTRNMIVRSGINHPIGGYIGQNWWHRLFFDTTDFKPGNYQEFFLQIGTYKPYTLY